MTKLYFNMISVANYKTEHSRGPLTVLSAANTVVLTAKDEFHFFAVDSTSNRLVKATV